MWEFLAGIYIQPPVEEEGHGNPRRAPHGRLAHRNDVLLPVKHAEVKREENKYKSGEKSVEPPVLTEGEEELH